jgi:branched-chain amino acid transport system substrate-binding protein
MKKLLTTVLALTAVLAFSLPDARSQTKQGSFTYEDKIGVVKIKPGDPIRIGVWFVVAGPDASLGEDTKRGVEIAVDDKKGKLLGHPIKLIVQDEGCNAEGGQAAATKLAADKTIVAAIGSNCGSAARAGRNSARSCRRLTRSSRRRTIRKSRAITTVPMPCCSRQMPARSR